VSVGWRTTAAPESVGERGEASAGNIWAESTGAPRGVPGLLLWPLWPCLLYPTFAGTPTVVLPRLTVNRSDESANSTAGEGRSTRRTPERYVIGERSVVTFMSYLGVVRIWIWTAVLLWSLVERPDEEFSSVSFRYPVTP